MQIELLSYNENPRNLSASAARCCYSKKPIYPEDCENWETNFINTDKLLKDLYIAGHNSTMEHSYFTLMIKDVSRHFIWRYLHGFPFYSTDQQSQRYVEISEDSFHIPYYLSIEDKEIVSNHFNKVHIKYKELTEKLSFDLEKEDLLNKQQFKIKKKKSMEFARYILPISQKTFLTYTINFITAIRLIGFLSNVKENEESFLECQEFSLQLENILINIDKRLEDIINLSKKDFEVTSNAYNFKDKKTLENVENKGVVITSNNFSILKEWEIKINEKQTPVKQNLLNTVNFTSNIICSHSCDSQNQRHRTSMSFRPNLSEYFYDLKEKYYTPELFSKLEEVGGIYKNVMKETYELFDMLVEKYGFNNSLFVLPNSQKVFIVENNMLSYFSHKSQKRLCYNSQEEIFHLTKKIVSELSKYIDVNEFELEPPCKINFKYGKKPTCPEGSRFCGVKVWQIKKMEDMVRVI